MKNDENIIDKLLNDNSLEENMVKELESELNKELNKPYEYIDYEKVAELSSAITEILDGKPDHNRRNENINKIENECNAIIKRKKIKKIYTWISAFSACLVLVLSLNIYTLNSFGDNLFTTIVRMTESGFSLDFNSESQEGPASVTTAVTNKTTTTSVNTTDIPILTTVTTSLSAPAQATKTTTPGELIPTVSDQAPGSENTTTTTTY